MKRHWHLLILAALILCLPTCASALELSGWGGNFMIHDDVGAQLRKDLWTDEEVILLSSQFGFLYHPTDAMRWFMDFNAHILITAEEFDNPRLYLLAGLNIELDGGDAEFGANLGAGISVMTTDTMAYFVEVKYVAGLEKGVWVAVGVHF